MSDLIKYRWCEHGMTVNDESSGMHYYRGVDTDSCLDALTQEVAALRSDNEELEKKNDEYVEMIKRLMKDKKQLEEALEECQEGKSGG